MKRIGIPALVPALGDCEMGDRDNKLALSTLFGLGAGGLIGWYYAGGGFTDRFVAASLLGAGTAAGSTPPR